jgi:mannose-6-phosphate isomerase-like protein (cupin superfamily)
MRRLVAIVWSVTLVLAYMAGSTVGPGGSAAQTTAGAQPPAPAGALPPGDHSKIQIAPDQGQPTHYSGEALRKAHLAMQARAKGGQAGVAPRDLMTPLVTRNYSYIMVHRALNTAQPAQKPAGELHEGVTDVYYIVGGSGTVYVGGEMENRRVSRPGEFLGQMAAGQPFKLQAGDILTVPPNMAHGTVPDAGGMTYVLQKINVGLYPWSLINGTP